MTIEKERAEPPEPAAVVLGGVRYQSLPWGKARGLGQNGGYIAATDPKTGEELWILKVYDVSYDRDMEADKLDVFISKIAPEGPAALRIENEKGRVYRVDLKDRTVQELTN